VSTTADSATTALSTAPAPVESSPPPGRRSPREVVLRLWRQLTSMRTALVLLFLLALASVPGTVLPQQSLAPSEVSGYLIAHPSLGRVMQRLDLFNVFGSPWYAAIYVLLFISLVGCVLPRSRIHLRAVRARPPKAPARFSRLPESTTWVSATPPEGVTTAAAAVLRRGRWRVDTAGTSVAAEKGYLRETGNLLFHCSLVLLMLGVGFGSVFGYQGDKLVVQGQGMVNDPAVYDQYFPGRLTTASSLQPFEIIVNRFTASYLPDGEPSAFHAYVTSVARPGARPRQVDLQVNHPITFGNANVYLLGHGYAVHFILRNAAGRQEFNAEVPCIPLELTDYLSQCVVKAPDTGVNVAGPGGSSVPLQFGVLADFAPTAAYSLTRGLISTFPQPRLPRVVIEAYTGDLGLDEGIPQSVYTLDSAGMHQVAQAVLTPGARGLAPSEPTQAAASGLATGFVRLPHGFTLQVAGVTNWVSLQVKDDPGKRVVLLAAVLIVLGLLFSLRVRRRRLWLRATPAPGGHTLVEVGGLARTDADGFSSEFPGLVEKLSAAAPPVDHVPSPTDPAAPPDKEE